MEVLSQYKQDDMQITEYTKDGITVSHTVKVPIQTEPIEPVEPQPTLEEIAQTTLLETQYQTIMLEMLTGF